MHVPPDLQDGFCSRWWLGIVTPETGREVVVLYMLIPPEAGREWSGWRDLNARLLRPERSALPDWATSRHDVMIYLKIYK